MNSLVGGRWWSNSQDSIPVMYPRNRAAASKHMSGSATMEPVEPVEPVDPIAQGDDSPDSPDSPGEDWPRLRKLLEVDEKSRLLLDMSLEIGMFDDA